MSVTRKQVDRFFKAAEKGDIKTLEKLLLFGINPNVRDLAFATVLHKASYWGHTDCCKLLLKAGVNPNIRDDLGWTAIDWANFNNNKCAEIIKEFIWREKYPTTLWSLSSAQCGPQINPWFLKSLSPNNSRQIKFNLVVE